MTGRALEVLATGGDLLGRVDSLAGAELVLDVQTGAERRLDLGRHVGSVELREEGAGLLVAAQGGFRDLDPRTGRHELLAAVAPDDPSVLMNDAPPARPCTSSTRCCAAWTGCPTTSARVW